MSRDVLSLCAIILRSFFFSFVGPFLQCCKKLGKKMKSIVLLLLFTLLCLCVNGNRLLEFDFNHWKQLNVKLYDNKTMESEAYANFVANKREIDEHNLKYAKGEVTFARAVNKYADWSIERKRKWLNGFVLNTTVRQAYEDYLGLSKRRDGQVEARAELPDFVDWRTSGYVTPVQDQGIVHCLLKYFNCLYLLLLLVIQ